MKFSGSRVLAVFAGLRIVLSASLEKMMQKSPVTSSVALSRLENETVMPKREKTIKFKKVVVADPLVMQD